MSVSCGRGLWYATWLVLPAVTVGPTLAASTVTLGAVAGAESVRTSLRASLGRGGVVGALAVRDLSAPSAVASVRAVGARAMAVGGGFRVVTLAGWRSGSLSTPDASGGPGSGWAVRPSTSVAAPRGVAAGARVAGRRLHVAWGRRADGEAGDVWVAAVGDRGRGPTWELVTTSDDGGVWELAVGARGVRSGVIAAARKGGDRRAFRLWARTALGDHRVDVVWERAEGAFDGVLGRPRSGWSTRLSARAAGVSWGTRSDGSGAGLHGWARRHVGDVRVRVDGWAPRAGGTRIALEVSPEPVNGWRWRLRLRVRHEGTDIGLLTGITLSGDVLGIGCRVRVDHASAAPARTAAYLGGGAVSPVSLDAGQRMTTLELRRGPFVLRLFEAASPDPERGRMGGSVAVEPRGRGT